MLDNEQQFWKQGMTYVAGVDEVGRGCLFGDVVAAAVIMPQSLVLEGINDSKKLSEKKRESLYEEIVKHALAIGVGRVDAATIDEINIKQAARLAMKKAVEQCTPQPDQLLIDAETIHSHIPQLGIIKGDEKSHSIAAASIIAKVTRDRLCHEWGQLYPEYDIAKHKGYATKKHREMILEFGPSPMHRRTFLSNIVTEQLELF
ncbi:ribonuclease HII [Longirhabdus pacifica]|uniref:ribonuclease HII n=1 Tax=Longirhabdus pacifica TaxID=2305227 RepID=UPI001008E456|nr:ribonuclease HII [Longirhabdus pacifica]